MPECVTATISISACSPPANAPLRSPLSNEANGSFSLRVLRRERFDAVEGEEELERHRLLTSERAVIVKGRDTLVRRNEVGRTFLRYLIDKGHN